jgi:hypothetical protein
MMAISAKYDLRHFLQMARLYDQNVTLKAYLP